MNIAGSPKQHTKIAHDNQLPHTGYNVSLHLCMLQAVVHAIRSADVHAISEKEANQLFGLNFAQKQAKCSEARLPVTVMHQLAPQSNCA